MLILIMGAGHSHTGGTVVLLYTYVYNIMNVCAFVIRSFNSLIAIAFHHRGRVKKKSKMRKDQTGEKTISC